MLNYNIKFNTACVSFVTSCNGIGNKLLAFEKHNFMRNTALHRTEGSKE